jgi:hypothetical protein
MIRSGMGPRQVIAFVSYWELAKLIAMALGISTLTTAIGFSLWWWLIK